MFNFSFGFIGPGLLGSNDEEQAKVEMMIDAGEDIRLSAFGLFYEPDFVRLCATLRPCLHKAPFFF